MSRCKPRPLRLVAILAIFGIAPALAATPDLLTARVWGLLKYHHPAVTSCQVDWDQALLDRWPALEDEVEATRIAALTALIDQAGATPRRAADAATPEWIAAAPLPADLRERLAWIAAQQPARQCYVDANATMPASFEDDAAHFDVASPGRALRALAALRYWNAIDYFFPYKEEIGRDWGDVLLERLPEILDAPTTPDYITGMRRLGAAINDSHGFFSYPGIQAEQGAGPPPLLMREVEGRDVVLEMPPLDSPVRAGDEVLAIDGEDYRARMHRLDAIAGWGSNPTWRSQRMRRLALRGLPDPAQLRLRRPDGSVYDTTLPRGLVFPATLPPPWQRRELEQGCSIGVVDLVQVAPERVGEMLEDLAGTDALLIDIRNYPPNTVFELVEQLFDEPRAVARLTAPDLSQPGRFEPYEVVLGGSRPRGYAGRLLLLQDEESISHAEYSLMLLQASGRALVFGSQTAAADGNITSVWLPGGLQMTFTGLGVFYPDGRSTQRVGIIPDVHVTRTIAGVSAGRDELVEAALDCRWITETPPRRLPPQGHYYDPRRGGEGMDIHRDANGTVVVLNFAYDDEGRPEWIRAAGQAASGIWQRDFQRARRDGSAASLSGHELDAHAGPYEPVCAISDQSRLHPRARWQRPGRATCMQPLLLSGAGPATGVWVTEEGGWGLSLHQRDELVVAVVYAYDAAGEPRWLYAPPITWDDGAELVFELLRSQGSCASCVHEAPDFVPAGTLRLRLDNLVDNDPARNRLSIDAEFAPGDRWQRSDAPLTRIVRSAGN